MASSLSEEDPAREEDDKEVEKVGLGRAGEAAAGEQEKSELAGKDVTGEVFWLLSKVTLPLWMTITPSLWMLALEAMEAWAALTGAVAAASPYIYIYKKEKE